MSRADPVEVCLLCLEDAASPQIWRAAVWELGEQGDRRATPHLLRALDYPDWECRHYAIMALGRLEDPAAAPELERRLTDGYLSPRPDDAVGPLPEGLAAHLREDIARAVARCRVPGSMPEHP
jgi:HEAT repeat protein